jgi:GAF domain-containing protein
VSTALAVAREQADAASPLQFPAEDGGHSLAEMAQRDLDAALQLLADRAQYITGASGAAIALRRDGKNDMLCRASSGTSAPELGALLSTEFGLSGESVRTGRLLRCDDAESDLRVNREVCRELGIASVVVTPVVHDDEVLGVFELFSGTANAFGDRDLLAVQRLAEMVETAVRLAQATECLPEQLRLDVEQAAVDPAVADAGTEKGAVQAEGASGDGRAIANATTDTEVERRSSATIRGEAGSGAAAAPAPEPPASGKALPGKKLFWSAAVLSPEVNSTETDQTRIPPILRELKKCEACGFPVSSGRALCVECEEKKWRGQWKPAPLAEPETDVGPTPAPQASETTSASPNEKREAASPAGALAAQAAAAPNVATLIPATQAPASPTPVNQVADVPARETSMDESPAQISAQTAVAEGEEYTAKHSHGDAVPSASDAENRAPELILSAAAEEKQSWIGANKYVIVVLLIMAGAIAAVFFLR